MRTYFKNKVVWITGASSGIGEALALELAALGARLVLSARRADELERVARRAGLPADRVLVLPMDVTDFGAAPARAAAIEAHFGRIDVMIHNAGVSQRSSVRDTTMEVYQKLMDVDFFSTVALTKAVLPGMITRKSGHFIVVSSVAGKVGTPKRSGYNAAKHALHGFYDSLRSEVYDDGIRVTLGCPGYINTQVSVNALNERGEKLGTMDVNQANGMPADQCARQLLQAAAADRKEVYIGGFTEVVAVYLRRFWPGLLFRLVRRNSPK